MGTFFFIILILLSIGNSGKERKNEYRKQVEREQTELRRREREAEERERRRQNTPYFFNEGFSEPEFKNLVYREARHIKGITSVTVDGLVIRCKVTSVSGKSDWYFKLDFNDFGHFTKRCWRTSDNWDSSIPERLESLICIRVESLLNDAML